MTECPVCVEKYNKSSRRVVLCLFCNFESCIACASAYLLTQSSDPHCMHCKHVWDIEFMRNTFTKTFINNTYKKHREEILLEREKSLLPSAQLEIEKDMAVNAKRAEIKELNRQIRDLQDIKNQLNRELFEMRNGEGEEKWVSLGSNNERHKFIKQCPADGCRGFLSTGWKCGMCEAKVCRHCQEIFLKNEDDGDDERTENERTEHKCNENSVKTLEMLSKDTKSCPGCGVPIFKINGCNQMFCQHEDTEIWMWSGEKKLAKDICIGDVLIGGDGKPCKVESLTYGEDTMYTVHQTGVDYKVIGNHLLTLWKTDTEQVDITVLDYLNLPEHVRESGYRKSACRLINWPEQKVSVDPYLFGLELGFTYDRIPTEYLRNSAEVRREVLRGIIASVGCISMNLQLQKDISDLVHSIGLSITCFGKVTVNASLIKITKGEVGRYVGWSIDNESKRYLLGDGTITHNCVECKCAFNWNTRKIETGVIHNPHFYEWQREMGNETRVVGDVQCGGLVGFGALHGYITSMETYNLRHGLFELHRSVGHYEDITRRLTTNTYNPQLDLDLRIRYLKNFIDDDEWKTRLYARYKKREKEKMLRDVFETYTTVVTDILNQIVREKMDARAGFERCIGIYEYCNSQIDRVNNLFGGTSPKIVLDERYID